jgi:hypothetical protein
MRSIASPAWKLEATSALVLATAFACGQGGSAGSSSADGGSDASSSGGSSGGSGSSGGGSGSGGGSSSGSGSGSGSSSGSGGSSSGSGSGGGSSSGSSSGGSCPTNSDAELKTGVAFSNSCTQAPCYGAGSVIKTSGGTSLWDIDVDAFDTSAGSGTMSIDYTGTGTISWTINYAGINSSPVNGYPNVQLGSADGAPVSTPGSQGLTFPQLLSAMSSLVIETSYSLACTTCPGNMDVMYDQWLTPTAVFSGGQSGSQEVSIFLYYAFAESLANGSPVATVTEPVTINGNTNPSFVWDIFAPGGLSAGHQIIVVPDGNHQGLISGDVTFDQLPILSKVASLAGESGWYFSGPILGTEFGDGATANFTFTLNKLRVTQCP